MSSDTTLSTNARMAPRLGDSNGLKIAVAGVPFFAGKLAEFLSASGVNAQTVDLLQPATIAKAGNFDVIHILFSPLVTGYGALSLLHARILLRKRVVVHWIGTDVLMGLNQRRAHALTRLLKTVPDIHLADAPWLVDELRYLGVEAEQAVLPYNFGLTEKVPPLPVGRNVLVYLPFTRYDFYGGETVETVIREFSDATFFVVGRAGARLPPLQNAIDLGWVKDMNEIYRRTRILIRIPDHDGLSAMVLEALAAGRRVIYSYPFPHCLYARTHAQLTKVLEETLSENTPNFEGARYARENYGPRRVLERLLAIYERLS